MTRFICIGGKAQNGKDTLASMLKRHFESNYNKVLIVHYADLLKFICKNYFGWNGKKDSRGRTLLQRVGTEGVRSSKPDYWVDFVLDIVDLFPNEWEYIIIPDTRFPNEITKIKERGYDALFVRVQRLNFTSPLSIEQQNHKSETALDDTVADITIYNDTLESLDKDAANLREYITADWSQHVTRW